MNILVMKFGGTSVGDAPRLREIVEITRNAAREQREIVLVCSALPGVTNALIDMARAAANGQTVFDEAIKRDLWARHQNLAEMLIYDDWEREALFGEWQELTRQLERLLRSIVTLRDVSARSLDAVSSLGERWCVRLVAAILREEQIAARVVDATDLLVTDERYGAASPIMEQTSARVQERLLPLLGTGIIPVVTGYIGCTLGGAPTTLGRGGGDYSATILGAALDAQEVWIWSDVNGILTADPKVVPHARTIAELSYSEATEIATFGSEVLHPRTIAPLAERRIPLRIRNTFQPEHPGTLILAETTRINERPRTIITSRPLALLTVRASDVPDVAGRALTVLAAEGIEVLMMTQSFAERSMTLVVREADAPAARRELADAFSFSRHDHESIRLQAPVATVSIVGSPARENNELVTQSLAALSQAGSQILALAQAANAYHLSFVLPEHQMMTTVHTLHTALGLDP